MSRFAPLLLLLGVGCAPDVVEVRDREVLAACGTCVFQIPRSHGCFWAVEIDGAFLPASGPAVPPVDMVAAHSPGGMCTMARSAVVDGTVSGGRFVATRFDLAPLTEIPEGAAAPAHAH